MKVLVLGNVGSGKSTILREGENRFSVQGISIDSFRHEVGDGTMEGEKIARTNFLKAIVAHKRQMLECSGIGAVADALFDIFSDSLESLLIIVLEVPRNLCIERVQVRDWPPFPAPRQSIELFMEKVAEAVETKEIVQKWAKRPNTHITFWQHLNHDHTERVLAEIEAFLQGKDLLDGSHASDIVVMQSRTVQQYYSNEYSAYQKGIVNRNVLLTEDACMIERFIRSISLSGIVADVGAGTCQWFNLVQDRIMAYYAIDSNVKALKLAPSHKKLFKVHANIFDENSDLSALIQEKVDVVILSFFISHYSDSTLAILFYKLRFVEKVIIIDSLWDSCIKERYFTKELTMVRRNTSKGPVYIPKRFFEASDIKRLAEISNRTITSGTYGNYWFICQLSAESKC